MELLIRSEEDADRQLGMLRRSADGLANWLRKHDGSGVELLRALKFEAAGTHPVSGHDLNAIEQINQTFTYFVALAASRMLLQLHPDAGGFILAPGAHMSRALDIMSVAPGLVGAETFAAVDPRNNRKLAKDLKKLSARPEVYRYVFFASPRYPDTKRHAQLETGGVEVWSMSL